METPLDRLAGLTREHLSRLADQWITTVEQLAALAAHQPFRPFLAERLGIEHATLAELLRPYDGALLTAAPGPHHRHLFGMGVRLSPVMVRSLARKNPYARAVLAAAPVAADLPSAVNLAPQMQPVRDQGSRGTCLSFASCAAREFIAPEAPDLSEQFFYWACKQLDGEYTGEGTCVRSAAGAMNDAGTCLEATLLYVAEACEPSCGPTPPPMAFEEARDYAWPHAHQIPARLEILKRILNGADGDPAQPVVIAVETFESSFFAADVYRTGRITIPFFGEQGSGGHALCVVGYQDDVAAPGGGYLIIRNSWGTRWATNSLYGAGYGLMPYAYFELYGVDAMSLARQEAFAGGAGKLNAVAVGAEDEDADDGPGDLVWGKTPAPAPRASFVCGVCGQVYLSRFSMVRGCEVCGSLICQACATLKGASRCRTHQA